MFATLLGASLHASAFAAARPIDEIFQAIKEKATRKAFEVQIAESQAEQAKAQYLTALTRWVPRADLQLYQSYSQDYSIITSGALGTLVTDFTPLRIALSRWELNLSLPIYRRSVHLAVEQGYADRDLNQARWLAKRGELDWRLRSLFGNYLLQSYKVATIKNSIAISKTNLKEAALRFELGQKTKVDVLRARSNLVLLESQELGYLQQQQTERNNLLEYSGLESRDLDDSGLDRVISSENELIRAIERFAAVNDVLPAIQEALDEKERENFARRIANTSPVYRTFVAEEESNLSKSKQLSVQEWPEVALRGSLSKQAPDWTQAFSGGQNSYSFGLVVNIPLFTGGAVITSSNEQARSAQASALKSQRDILQFLNELETDRSQIRSLLLQLRAQEINLEQNEEIVRLSFKSYQLGKATMVELLGSQNDLINSKINLAKTRLDLSVLSRKLAWHLGVAP